jgi:hypothetical protein
MEWLLDQGTRREAVGRGLLRMGLGRGLLSRERLLAQAVKRGGGAGWGIEGPPAGLDVLLRSLEREADLHLRGRFVAHGIISRALVNRLRCAAEAAAHPEALTAPVRRPLVIVGLHRTGTTFLHRLLALDPAALSLPTWLALRPCPLPTARELAGGSSRRIELARADIEDMHRSSPATAAKHPMAIDEPEEESVLLQSSFTMHVQTMSMPAFAYRRWALEQDQRAAFRFLQQRLQLLQAGRPGTHWVLKSPFHLPFLSDLLAVFPDACIVHTHRDPARAVPSYVDFEGHLHAMVVSAPRSRRMMDEAAWMCRESIRRAAAARAVAPEERFLDVHYRDLVADPIATVRRIHDHFGLAMSPEFEARLRGRRRDADRPAGPPYRAEDFGWTDEAIRADYRDYIERHAVAKEGS